MNRGETELIRRIYNAQKTDKTKGDFADLVMQDLHKLNITETEEEIQKMTKKILKNAVKEKVKIAALKHLMTKKTSKTEKLNYKSLQMQSYLKSSMFTEQEAKLLLALRTRTVRGIRTDFPGMYPTRECPMMGCREEDTLPHLLTCTVLLENTEQRRRVSRVEMEHLYSGSMEQQLEVTQVFGLLLDTRTQLEEDGTPAPRDAGSHALT